MKKFRFKMEKAHGVGGLTDVAYVLDAEDPAEALVKAAVRDLSTTVELTVSDVTMHLAAWEDPEHWSSDWAAKLGVEFDEEFDAYDEVMKLISSAVVDE